jgi:hypothetical protein
VRVYSLNQVLEMAGVDRTADNLERLVIAGRAWEMRDARDRRAFFGQRVAKPGANTTTGIHNPDDWTMELYFIADFAEAWAERVRSFQ